MSDSFASMYRQLQLWVPELPLFLARRFINDRYRRIAERRPWGALRAEGEFLPNGAYTTGTASVTRGSATVTGSGTSWDSSQVGRQFMAGNRAPVYTVAAVGGATSLTLDRVYGGDTAADTSYRILDAYVTVPADFRSFMVVLDPRMNWRLRHFMTQEDLARLDPARSSAGTPWAVVDRRFASDGRAQYELWPYTTGARNYPFYYIKRVADLTSETDTPFNPLRGDEIVKGALADLVRWPGTREFPNPMFGHPRSLDLYLSFEREFEDMLVEAERHDEEMFLTWLSDHSWANWPFAPLDAAYLQNHAF